MEVSVGIEKDNSTGAACKGTKHGLFLYDPQLYPLTVFKIASVPVYLDHVARYIEHANHSIV
jgi:hypothetical protein